MMQKEIDRAVDTLNKGGIILYPTDTVWGLGCDATNPSAIEKIYQIKRRPDSKSLITLVSNFLMLQQYVEEVPFKAVELMEEAVGPLTVIYPKARNLAKNLLPEDGSIGIRIPNDDFCKSMISSFGKPIVSTSANISGQKPSSIYRELSDEIISASDYVVKWRQDDETLALPSSIIKVNADGSIIKIR